MKKLFVVMCLVVCLVVSGVFTGCETANQGGENTPTAVATPEPTPVPTPTPYVPKTIEELWNKIDETMGAAESYRLKSSMLMKYFYEEQELVSETEVEDIFSSKDGNKYSFSKGKVHIVYKEADYTQDSEQIRAYYDGKMYYGSIFNGLKQRFCSKMSYDEYVVARDNSPLDDSVYLDCTKKEFAQNDDGTWQIKLSGYTGKAIAAFLEDSGTSEKELGSKVLDIELNILVDGDFYEKKSEMRAVFENSEKAQLEVFGEYFDINATEPNTADLKTSEYVEVADVRVLDNVSEAIKNLEKAKKAKFTYEVTQKLELKSGTSSYNEKDVTTFGVENGKYYYDIDITSSNGNGTIKYRNGIYEVVGTSNKYQQSEDEAKDFIASLIDGPNYNSLLVSEIKKTGENTFELKIGQPVETGVKNVFDQIQCEITKIEQTIKVTFEGENIKKIESALVAKGDGLKYGSATLKLETKLTVNEATYN